MLNISISLRLDQLTGGDSTPGGSSDVVLWEVGIGVLWETGIFMRWE